MSPFKKPDKWIVVITIMLITIGMVMIYSSTSVVSPGSKRAHTEFHYFNRQFMTLILSFIMLVAAYKTNIETFQKYSVHIGVLAFVLLVAVFIPGLGVKVGKAKRWLRLGISTFQPSEFAKLAIVIFLSGWFSRKDKTTGEYIYDPKNVRHLAVPIGAMLTLCAICVLQSDLGATICLFVITLCLLIVSDVPAKYIGYVSGVAAPLVLLLIWIEPYRWMRLVSFWNPWKDKTKSGFQLVQSLVAFGSGGLLGEGLGNGKQKLMFLPEVHTDFIFAMIGEELGLFGAIFIVLLFLALFMRGMFVAERKAGDRFLFFLSYGITIMIGLQAVINFFVVTGMAPTKGLPLPFISYGGSALLVNMIAVGILLNVSRDVDRHQLPLVVNRVRGILRQKSWFAKVTGKRA